MAGRWTGARSSSSCRRRTKELLPSRRRWTQIARITDPRAVVVIGGQQAGLFSGPLYTIHKAVTVLRLSAELEAELGRPVIPVFWIAAEDSDVAEVDHAVILDQAGELREVSLRQEGEPGGGPGASAGKPPVSTLRFGPEIGEAVAALAAALPEGAFATEMLEGVRAAYAPGRSYPQAFGRLMAWLFSGQGLVLVDPSDPRLKSMALPLFRREIEEKSPVSAAVREQSQRLHQGRVCPADRAARRHAHPLSPGPRAGKPSRCRATGMS